MSTLSNVRKIKTSANGTHWYRGTFKGQTITVTVPPNNCRCGCGEYETECRETSISGGQVSEGKE